MKKLNYYEVHKNKNPKRKLGNSLPKFMIAINKAIVCAMEVSQSLMEMYNAQKRIIPIYKMGQNRELSIIGNNEPEMFVDKNGKSFIIGPSEKIRKAFE